MKVSIDFETRAIVDLKETGIYPYALDPGTDIWCFAYAFDDEEPEIWYPGLPFPERLRQHIEAGGEMRAWNAAFERLIWKYIGVPRYGFPEVKMEQWVCTAVEAAAMALPRSLDQAGRVTGLAQKKDQDGYELMMRMTRPRKARKGEDPNGIYWFDDDGRKQRLYEYCKQDVRVEQAMAKIVRPLSDFERTMYLYDQIINDRGIGLDRQLVLAAQRIVEEGTARANAALSQLTGGMVTEVTQTGQLREWLGVESVAKAKVAEMLESDLDPTHREALEVRLEAGKSSVAKLESMLAYVNADDRMRHLLMFLAANTGRWGGKGPQPQNYPRPLIKKVERFIPHVLAEDYDAIDLYEPPIVVVSSMLRSMLKAPNGKTLMAGDYASIEAVVLNWLAGQEDILELFRQYFAGDKTKDPYVVMASRMKGCSLEEAREKYRQPGKAAELGCGYQMGWKKFISAAWDVYQVRVDEEESKRAVAMYRETHPMVVQFWDDANEAAMNAVANPGEVYTFGGLQNLKFVVRGKYLWLRLPSGRLLSYPAPRLEMTQRPWGEMGLSVTYSAIDGKTHQWVRHILYGGLIVENIVQAVSRDLLSESIVRLEQTGRYPVVLHAHDEIVSETSPNETSVKEMEEIMSILPEWAAGLPIKVEGWQSERYRK